MMDFWIPQTLSGEIVDITLLEVAVVQRANACWECLRENRRFPSDPGGVLKEVGSNALLPRVLVTDMPVLRDPAFPAMPQRV
jgi:hypothetical protein